MADEQDDAGARARVPHRLSCLDRIRHRLLDEHVLASLRGGERDVAVRVVRGGDEDALDAGIVQKRLDRLRGPAVDVGGRLAPRVLVPREAGRETDPLRPRRGHGDASAPHPEAHEADPDRHRHAAATTGSNGTSCNDLAPSLVTIVRAPSCRPMRSSGVIGFGWITIAMFRPKRRPSGAGESSFHGQ